MKQSPAPGSAANNGGEPGGDPWAAFGYLVAGVLVYGAAGWGLSIWLNASYWIPIGILVGAGFGLYLVFARTLLHGDTSGASSSAAASSVSPDLTTTDDAARKTRPASDDRGETA